VELQIYYRVAEIIVNQVAMALALALDRVNLRVMVVDRVNIRAQ
jgi:hypothetical protein